MSAAVRVLVQLDLTEANVDVKDFLNALTSNDVRSRRPGCIQYEQYQSVTNPEHIIVSELFDSLASYDEHWKAQLEEFPETNGIPPLPAGIKVSFEFYNQQEMEYIQDAWRSVDTDLHSEAIRWP